MSESPTIIRVLNIEDIPLLEDVLSDGGYCFSSDQLRKYMEQDGNLAFGAIKGTTIVGFIYGYSLCQINDERPQFFVYSVDVHSCYRNMGIGSKLFQYVVDYCYENKYAEVFVPTDKGNPRACRVYEKAGGKNDFENELIYVIKFE